jgi:excisionase family DNA binding protein
MVTMADRELSSSQAARRLGVSQSLIRVLVASGKLPAKRTPLGALILASDIDRLREERAKRPVGPGRPVSE